MRSTINLYIVFGAATFFKVIAYAVNNYPAFILIAGCGGYEGYQGKCKKDLFHNIFLGGLIYNKDSNYYFCLNFEHTRACTK
jgi:hypothetical protein